jgi:Tol biopolymer transport system component
VRPAGAALPLERARELAGWAAGRIAYTAPDGAICVTATEGGDVAKVGAVEAPAYGMASSDWDWSPDGSLVASASHGDIWLALADGTASVNLTRDGNVLDDDGLRWSPDGRWLVFRAWARGGASDLWLYELGQGELRNLTQTSSPGAGAPVWSPDSRRLGYGAAGEVRVMAIPPVVDPTTGRARSVPASTGEWEISDCYPRWSPDGSLIGGAMENLMAQYGRTCSWAGAVSPDGTEQRMFLVTDSRAIFGSWAPDSLSAICWAHNYAERSAEAWMVYVDGRKARRLPHGAVGSHYVWSSDGRRVFFQAPPDWSDGWGDLCVLDIADWTIEPLAAKAARPSLSPDGRTLAFERCTSGEPYTEVWLMDLATRTERQLTHGGGYGPKWSPVRRRP